MHTDQDTAWTKKSFMDQYIHPQIFKIRLCAEDKSGMYGSCLYQSGSSFMDLVELVEISEGPSQAEAEALITKQVKTIKFGCPSPRLPHLS